MPEHSTGTRHSEVTTAICRPLEEGPGWWWWPAFLVSLTALLIGVAGTAYQIRTGIGTWGQNRSVGWALDITNFVFWIGIGHAGTFISAVLYLLRQHWRVSINRSAEAATLLAVFCAALFPVIHLGRPWLAFWMVPYPNFRGPLWINFRSPLVWDFFAIGTYFTISVIFFYLGLLPDLATLRERARGRTGKAILSFLSLGWDFSQHAWHRHTVLYRLTAGLATALVVSVHTIVSWDFASSIVPGWHNTLFPPYFVVGAIFSGLALVLTLIIVLRWALRLQEYITIDHVERLCKLLIVCSLFIGFVYAAEFFDAYSDGSPQEVTVLVSRISGKMAPFFLIAVIGNVLLPQLFWIRRMRRSCLAVLPVVMGINLGMWLERFVIIVGSLQKDYLPATWISYFPTWFEISMTIGGFGLFCSGFLLFTRWIPMVSISEYKHYADESEAVLSEAGTARRVP